MKWLCSARVWSEKLSIYIYIYIYLRVSWRRELLSELKIFLNFTRYVYNICNICRIFAAFAKTISPISKFSIFLEVKNVKALVNHGYPLLSANWIIFVKTFVFPGLFGHSYGTLWQKNFIKSALTCIFLLKWLLPCKSLHNKYHHKHQCSKMKIVYFVKSFSQIVIFIGLSPNFLESKVHVITLN